MCSTRRARARQITRPTTTHKTNKHNKKSGASDEASRNKAVALYPLQRLARAEEVAFAAAILLDKRAGFITGASLPVDGGFIHVQAQTAATV